MGFKLHVVEVGRDNLDDDQGVGTPITSCVVLPADVAPTKVAKVSRTKATPTLRAFMDAVRMGLRDHGHSITPFPDGPTVRAVDSEKVRASYYTMRADDLAENSRRTVFARHLGNAADRQAIVTRMIDGVTMIWLPTESMKTRNTPQHLFRLFRCFAHHNTATPQHTPKGCCVLRCARPTGRARNPSWTWRPRRRGLSAVQLPRLGGARFFSGLSSIADGSCYRTGKSIAFLGPKARGTATSSAESRDGCPPRLVFSQEA